MGINSTIRSILTFIALFFVINVQAQDTTYSLSKPVPKEKEREEMETDRPNITETPYTVDAGHFQYETDLFRYRHKTTEESKQRTWFINQADLKLGLLKNTSIQLIVQSFGKEENTELSTGERQVGQGFGDLTLRVKQNLYGNNKGNFSIALMPYVKFPTNKYSNNRLYEEGLMVPMVIKLPHDWKIGLQLEGDYLRDDDENARHGELLQSLVISKVLFDKLEVFGETYYTYNFKAHETHNFLDAALEYSITKNVKVDAGLNYGLQDAAEKEYFVGLAFRY